MGEKVSIIIPSRNEVFLKKTIESVLSGATGDIEIFPVLDGYDIPKEEVVDDPRVKYIRIPGARNAQKRHAINMAAILADGKYIMSLDAHCMVAKGFDEVLKADCKENWVVVPRRKRLDADNWCIQKVSKPDIDYLFYPLPFAKEKVRHVLWTRRAIERKDILIDENIIIQGSCWFMHKTHFVRNGFMQVEGYTGWGQNEAEEICFKTWLGGGKVMRNKKTWYAHLHKGNKYGRGYQFSWRNAHKGTAFSTDYWFNNRWKERKHDFSWLIERFMPMSTWPEDRSLWKKQ